MKTRLFFSVALIAALTLFTGAKFPAKGGITVTLKLDGKPVYAFPVGLALSEDDRDVTDYDRTEYSDENGKVTFLDLKPGMYYIGVFDILDEEDVFLIGQLDVRVSNKVEQVEMELVRQEQ